MNFTTSKNKIVDSLNLLDLKKVDSCIKQLTEKILFSIENNGKVLICGNGGSAAEAEHFAAELVCKFQKVRKGLPALTLHSNVPTITAIGNDLNFENIFSRNLEALGNKNDVLITLSTSGNSQNVIKALKLAKEMKIYSFALLGNDGGKMKLIPDDFFLVNSNTVSTIQEIHLMFLHALCAEIDSNDFV
tara:strand:+ start:100 stop:666 length:567 start_codon:yes stop_codon:yes gene_type:complete